MGKNKQTNQENKVVGSKIWAQGKVVQETARGRGKY